MRSIDGGFFLLNKHAYCYNLQLTNQMDGNAMVVLGVMEMNEKIMEKKQALDLGSNPKNRLAVVQVQYCSEGRGKINNNYNMWFGIGASKSMHFTIRKKGFIA